MSISFTAKINERNYTIEIDVEGTVLDAKSLLINQGGGDVSMRWIYKGRILADALLIKDTGIQSGEVVIVILSKTSTSTPLTAQPSSVPSSVGTLNSSMPSAPLSSVFNPRMMTINMDAAMNQLLSKRCFVLY